MDAFLPSKDSDSLLNHRLPLRDETGHGPEVHRVMVTLYLASQTYKVNHKILRTLWIHYEIP